MNLHQLGRGAVRTLVALTATTLAVSSLATVSAQAHGIPEEASRISDSTFIGMSHEPGDRYIVSISTAVKGLTAAQARTSTRLRVASLGGRVGASVRTPMTALIVTLPSRSAARELATSDGVTAVIPDGRITTTHMQSPTPSWGLDRIDELDATLDNSYTFPNAGTGVRVYVIDTGVRPDHVDFAGRILPGAYSIDDGRQVTDCDGHGTHVSGTAVGTTHGVAKGASLVPIRILDCDGAGYMGDILLALEWIAQTHPHGKPAVINLSLGGPVYQQINDAVEWMVDNGFVVVAAAGNSDFDACRQSPAGARAAITVASLANDGTRSSFSNWGRCVDIFAPGSKITSSWLTSATASAVLSGTSMAAPHVAGLVASTWERFPTRTARQVIDIVLEAGVRGAVQDRNGSPNLAAHVLVGAPDAPGDPTARQDESAVEIRWGHPVWDGGDIAEYIVEASKDGADFSPLEVTLTGSQTVVRIPGLVSGSTYRFRVSGRNAHGSSPGAVTAPLTYSWDGAAPQPEPEPEPQPEPQPGPAFTPATPGRGTVIAAPRPSTRATRAPRVRIPLGATVRLRVERSPVRSRTSIVLAYRQDGEWRRLGTAQAKRNGSITLPAVTAQLGGDHLLRVSWGSRRAAYLVASVG